MPPRVDFYVSEQAGLDARLRLACRVAEKAYLANQKVVALGDDAETLRRFDELLWTFGDGTFVPHDIVAQDGAPCDAPVALTTGPLPADHADVLINLGDTVPSSYENRRASPSSSTRAPKSAPPAAIVSRSTAASRSIRRRTTSEARPSRPVSR